MLQTRLRNGLEVPSEGDPHRPADQQLGLVPGGLAQRAAGPDGHLPLGRAHAVQGDARPSRPACSTGRSRATAGCGTRMTWLDWTAYFETMPAGPKSTWRCDWRPIGWPNSLFEPAEVDLGADGDHLRTPGQRERADVPAGRGGPGGGLPGALLSPRSHRRHGRPAVASAATICYAHYRSYYAPEQRHPGGRRRFPHRPHAGPDPGAVRPDPLGSPRRSLPRRPEPPQHGERRVDVEGPGETAYLEVAYHAPAGADPDFFPLAVLDSVLAGASSLNLFGGGISNKTSRLYRAPGRRRAGGRRSAGTSRPPSIPTSTSCEPPCAPTGRQRRCWRHWMVRSTGCWIDPLRRGGGGQGRQAGAGAVCLRQREHHQPGLLAGLQRDLRRLRLVRALPGSDRRGRPRGCPEGGAEVAADRQTVSSACTIPLGRAAMASRRRARATTPTRRKVKRAPVPSRRRVTTRKWRPEPGLPQLDIRSLPGPETIRRQRVAQRHGRPGP